MTSAVIGLLGVIIGGALTTYLARQNERRNRARAALGAGRLLAAELRNVHASSASRATAASGSPLRFPPPRGGRFR